MAVAERTTAAQPLARNPRQVQMMHSALGACYVLASLWLIFLGLPTLWRMLSLDNVFNEFLADSLLFLVSLPVIFGVFVLGRKLEGPNPVPGMRAGAAYLAGSVLIFGLLITSGSNLWSVIGMALLAGAILWFLQPQWHRWILNLEEQGWFHAVPFKPNQGLRVRRATVIGVMVLVICGVVTLVNHGTLNTGRGWNVVHPLVGGSSPVTDPWIVTIPFGTATYLFMYYISLTLPIVLTALASWVAWRLVSWPTFADFLIATEAEMNKVSWTTRKRLYQDTIVVLATVVLLTGFLFVTDILWIKFLTWGPIDVLKHDPQAAYRKNQSGAQW